MKDHSDMFRIVWDPSSGSIKLYLTEIRSGSLMFVVCLIGVWQRNFEPVVCVYGTAVWDCLNPRTRVPEASKLTSRTHKSVLLYWIFVTTCIDTSCTYLQNRNSPRTHKYILFSSGCAMVLFWLWCYGSSWSRRYTIGTQTIFIMTLDNWFKVTRHCAKRAKNTFWVSTGTFGILKN